MKPNLPEVSNRIVKKKVPTGPMCLSEGNRLPTLKSLQGGDRGGSPGGGGHPFLVSHPTNADLQPESDAPDERKGGGGRGSWAIQWTLNGGSWVKGQHLPFLIRI